MRKTILILVILVALFNVVYAGAIMTGVDWKSLGNDPDQDRAKLYKLMFVRGVYDGLGFAGDSEMKKMFYYEGEGNNFYGNLVEALDKFYLDSRNINITIVEALVIVSFELRGVKQEVIEGLRELGLKHANSRPPRQELITPDGLKKQQNEMAAPIVKGYDDNSQFWKAFGQGLFDFSQQQSKRARETESIQSNIQVIGTSPTYRINKGYVYPVDSDKSTYRINGSYLYPSDDNIHILRDEK